jgi:hypothetical protein
MQFSAGLHCQSESSAGQSSLGGVWRPAFAEAGRNGDELHYSYGKRGERTFKSQGRLLPTFPYFEMVDSHIGTLKQWDHT